MKSFFRLFAASSLCLLLTVGAFFALWYGAYSMPDEGVSEICVGSQAAPDWYLAQHRVAGKAYYTLRSGRGNTPWDRSFGNRPGSWLYFRRGESGAEENEIFLQRVDGCVWRVDLLTGAVNEIPPPCEPLLPMELLFARTDTDSCDNSY